MIFTGANEAVKGIIKGKPQEEKIIAKYEGGEIGALSNCK